MIYQSKLHYSFVDLFINLTAQSPEDINSNARTKASNTSVTNSSFCYRLTAGVVEQYDRYPSGIYPSSIPSNSNCDSQTQPYQ